MGLNPKARAEAQAADAARVFSRKRETAPRVKQNASMSLAISGDAPLETKNYRDVWIISPGKLKEDHYSAYPVEIPRRCIVAGSRPGDVVLDCFVGSGTSAIAAVRLEREFIGIELVPGTAKMAKRRITNDSPLFNGIHEVKEVPVGPSQVDLSQELE